MELLADNGSGNFLDLSRNRQGVVAEDPDKQIEGELADDESNKRTGPKSNRRHQLGVRKGPVHKETTAQSSLVVAGDDGDEQLEEAMERESAAIKVQRVYRGHLGRNLYFFILGNDIVATEARRFEAAIVVQCAFRSFKARNDWYDLLGSGSGEGIARMLTYEGMLPPEAIFDKYLRVLEGNLDGIESALTKAESGAKSIGQGVKGGTDPKVLILLEENQELQSKLVEANEFLKSMSVQGSSSIEAQRLTIELEMKNEEIEDLQDELNEKLKLVARLNHELEVARASSETSVEADKVIEAPLNAVQQSCEGIEQMLGTLANAVSAALDSRHSAFLAVSNLQATTDSLQRKNEVMFFENQALRDHVATLEKEQQKSMYLVAHLSVEIIQSGRNVAMEKATFQELAEEFHKNSADTKATAEIQAQELTNDVARIAEEKSALLVELHDVKGGIDARDREIERLQEQKDSAQQALLASQELAEEFHKNSADTKATAEIQAQELTNDVARIAEEKSALLVKLHDVKGGIDARDREIERLQEQKDSAQQALLASQRSLDQLEAQTNQSGVDRDKELLKLGQEATELHEAMLALETEKTAAQATAAAVSDELEVTLVVALTVLGIQNVKPLYEQGSGLQEMLEQMQKSLTSRKSQLEGLQYQVEGQDLIQSSILESIQRDFVLLTSSLSALEAQHHHQLFSSQGQDLIQSSILESMQRDIVLLTSSLSALEAQHHHQLFSSQERVTALLRQVDAVGAERDTIVAGVLVGGVEQLCIAHDISAQLEKAKAMLEDELALSQNALATVQGEFATARGDVAQLSSSVDGSEELKQVLFQVQAEKEQATSDKDTLAGLLQVAEVESREALTRFDDAIMLLKEELSAKQASLEEVEASFKLVEAEKTQVQAERSALVQEIALARERATDLSEIIHQGEALTERTRTSVLSPLETLPEASLNVQSWSSSLETLLTSVATSVQTLLAERKALQLLPSTCLSPNVQSTPDACEHVLAQDQVLVVDGIVHMMHQVATLEVALVNLKEMTVQSALGSQHQQHVHLQLVASLQYDLQQANTAIQHAQDENDMARTQRDKLQAMTMHDDVALHYDAQLPLQLQLQALTLQNEEANTRIETNLETILSLGLEVGSLHLRNNELLSQMCTLKTKCHLVETQICESMSQSVSHDALSAARFELLSAQHTSLLAQQQLQQLQQHHETQSVEANRPQDDERHLMTLQDRATSDGATRYLQQRHTPRTQDGDEGFHVQYASLEVQYSLVLDDLFRSGLGIDIALVRAVEACTALAHQVALATVLQTANQAKLGEWEMERHQARALQHTTETQWEDEREAEREMEETRLRERAHDQCEMQRLVERLAELDHHTAKDILFSPAEKTGDDGLKMKELELMVQQKEQLLASQAATISALDTAVEALKGHLLSGDFFFSLLSLSCCCLSRAFRRDSNLFH